MGKPFKKELERINDSLIWAAQADIENFSIFLNEFTCPIYIVGSGGSLSACYYAVSLAASKGRVAQAITPLELFNVRKTINNSVVVFISASGKNNDILFGFKTAIQEEPKGIACICMVEDSPLAKLGQQHTICKVFQYILPTGKDGFLATNSLIAFYTILSRAFNNNTFEVKRLTDNMLLANEIGAFINSINKDYTFFVLYSGWGTSVAIDIESKCTEAALGNVSLSDYRNFGHGRHHWFAKRQDRSAIIAIITPQEEELARKTLGELPMKIPKLLLKSNIMDTSVSIELLIKSFYFIKGLGEIQNIDPGRPGVPEFGRKLYNLRYQSGYKKKKASAISKRCSISIQRKLRINSLEVLKDEEFVKWKNHYDSFIKKINKHHYGSIVFDYDGTLCSSEERFIGLSCKMSLEILKILSEGFVVGVVTGRGKSVKEALRIAIPNKNFWSNIIVGYYNGSQIGALENDLLPDNSVEKTDSLIKIKETLDTPENPFKLEYSLRPRQLTIENTEKRNWEIAKLYIIQIIKAAQINDVQILESSHSVDIISNSISKTDIFHLCNSRAVELGKPSFCLSIGDKGQWPGNDFRLLDNSQSLSVDESSPIPYNGWNVASIGLRNIDATIEYLKCLTYEENKIKINITK